ncbi:hypothetical protein [Microbacterium sp. SORGH_AS_0888]|uniref:hypothetical protein n=1 Tax=Microbacterium sp. SORGH_AS_0888 TaxID=3041791 RepID=UPI0027881572|nr:hypothetical protein [Microbacterium sp. SORGH_AS_0888]MDQ1130106.1 uncharacterized protein YjbI with pentapeptide repeats [Microbacterium sp. SORGH_AS_0888]
MAGRRDTLTSPRDHAPDIPPILEDRARLSSRMQVDGARIVLTGADVDAAHSDISESRMAASSLGRLDLTGATLVDVAVDGLGAVEVVARESRWRNVVVDGGRIGTLDALRAEWDGVTLRGLRIDYLSLPSADVSDLLIVDCVIGTLDVPQAALTRVRFEGSRADEVETRSLRARDVDLRGLEALAFTDVRGLAGATISERQAEQHAVALAQALGIVARD